MIGAGPIRIRVLQSVVEQPRAVMTVRDSRRPPTRSALKLGAKHPTQRFLETVVNASKRLQDHKDVRSLHDLKTVYNITNVIASKDDLNEVFASVVDEILGSMPAKRVAIMTLDPKKNLIPILMRSRGDDNANGDLQISRTVLNEVIRDRVALL